MQVRKQLRFSVDATGYWRVEEKRKRMDARLVIRSSLRSKASPLGRTKRPRAAAWTRARVSCLVWKWKHRITRFARIMVRWHADLV